MATEKRLIDVQDCPCDGCKAKPCGHPARCVKFAVWLNKTVDAVEVVHARWKMTIYTTTSKRGRVISNAKFTCPECGYSNGRKRNNYCPNCGAKMDGDGNG